MKKSTKLLIGIIIGISFIAGFLIGIFINYPSNNNSELAGTVGKINNYRNVQITDSDIKLRSELLKDEAKLKKYQDYISFHYASSAKLGSEIDEALKASEQTKDFSEAYKNEIKSLTEFNNFLKEARKDLLIALSVLNNLYESDQQCISSLINNANNSIAQIKFREKTVTEFVLSIESFLKTRQVADFPKLKKAHDSLIINQVNKYVATNDKPMLKYLDKQILYSSKEELQSIANFKSDQLALLIIVDMESLKVIIPDGVDLKTDIMDTYSINSETFINAIADNDDNNLRAFDVTKLESNAALQVIF